LKERSEAITYLLTIEETNDSLEQSLRSIKGVTEVKKDEEKPSCYVITFKKEQTNTNAVLKTVLDCGCCIVSFNEKVRQLSQAFMDLTRIGM
ncbi:MAG: hypothetical protein ABIH42_01745, partial [Planctomycetota bacterium]